MLSFHYNFALAETRAALEEVLKKQLADSPLTVATSSRVIDLKRDLHREMYKRLQSMMSHRDIGFFPLLITMKEYLMSGRMKEEEFSLFRNHSLHQFPYHPDEIPNWVTKTSWANLDLLETSLLEFGGLKKHMREHQALYQEYFTLSPVLLEPSPWDEIRELSLPQRALLWLFTRPADMTKVFSDMISYELGSEMARARPGKGIIVSEIAPTLLIADSEDQGEVVHDVGRAAGASRPIKMVCLLRETMLDEAEHLLHQGVKNGYWVLFTQCQVIRNWSESLIELLTDVTDAMGTEAFPRRIHPGFRLILVSSLSETLSLPEELIQRFSARTHHTQGSLVTRIEQRALKFLSDSVPLKTDHIPAEIPGLLCQLHAHLLSSAPEGPGWGEGPGWSEGDMITALSLLCHLTTHVPDPSDVMDILRSLVGMVTYGGKCTTEAHTAFLYSAIDKFALLYFHCFTLNQICTCDSFYT